MTLPGSLTLNTLLVGSLVLSGLVYFGLAVRAALLCRARLPRLRDVPLPGDEPSLWPRLSLVIAARNEGDTLEAATLSRLRDDYPELEVVIVDDRSTDETGAIADRLAAADPRVKVVHLSQLPEGWLGKVHAMQRGLEASSGRWVLFSDADVHLAPGTLRRAVAFAEAEELGHLSVIPRFESRGFWVDTVMAAFMRMLMVLGRPWAVRDPVSRAALGGGLFNLVRRSALDRSPGLTWLKLEVGDDVALAQMLKRSGARTAVLDAVDNVHLTFYRSLGEMTRALEKNGNAAGKLNTPVLLGVLGLMMTLELSPILGLLLAPGPVLAMGAAVALLLALGAGQLLARWTRAPRLPALFFPLGMALLAAMMLRSGILGAWRGGIVWRETFYPAALLREGSRVELF